MGHLTKRVNLRIIIIFVTVARAEQKEGSLEVSALLEDIGVCENLRSAARESATTREILDTIVYKLRAGKCSSYVCGSRYEGTAMRGTSSDIDHLVISESEPVIRNLSEASSDGINLLMIQDRFTPPGYVKLQTVLNGTLLMGADMSAFNKLNLDPFEAMGCRDKVFDVSTDRENRLLRVVTACMLEDTKRFHGPAFTNPESRQRVSTDYVYGVRCCSWPACAQEWLTRLRFHEWPPSSIINQCSKLGFFLVPTGPPDSGCKHLLWRVSFSLQERLLVTSFNSIQLKCLVLLKLIKKDTTSSLGNSKVLTSYHCKTCLFYLAENKPSKFWVEDNLICCLEACIILIIEWIDNGVCPNYFIPDENMFRIKTDQHLLKDRLNTILKQIQTGNYENILNLVSHGSGQGYKMTRNMDRKDMKTKESSLLEMYWRIALDTLLFRNIILQNTYVTSVVGRRMLFYYLGVLVSTIQDEYTQITEHTELETKRAVELLLPHLRISLFSSFMVQQHLDGKNILHLVQRDDWTNMNKLSDLYSFKLKQASLLHMLGYWQQSLEILTDLQKHTSHMQVSICSCNRNPKPIPKDIVMDIESKGNDNSLEDFIKQFVVPCVVYMQCEKDLTPHALCFEMYRSFGMTYGSRHSKDFWFDWAVVDGKFLLHYLMFLNHRKLDLNLEASIDIEDMKWLLQTDTTQVHQETSLNLLGWAYVNMGNVDKAINCFQTSLRLRLFHNAAIWQVSILAFEKAKKMNM